MFAFNIFLKFLDFNNYELINLKAFCSTLDNGLKTYRPRIYNNYQLSSILMINMIITFQRMFEACFPVEISVTTSRSSHVCSSIKSKTSQEVVKKSVGRLRNTEQRPSVSGDWDTVQDRETVTWGDYCKYSMANICYLLNACHCVTSHLLISFTAVLSSLSFESRTGAKCKDLYWPIKAGQWINGFVLIFWACLEVQNSILMEKTQNKHLIKVTCKYGWAYGSRPAWDCMVYLYKTSNGGGNDGVNFRIFF